MLVLTRKKDESILIGQGIKITVLETAPGQVKLGITAPPEMEILRTEVFEAIREESKQAAATSRNLADLQGQLKGLLGGPKNPSEK